MASGSYRNGAPKVSSKLDRPPSAGYSTPKPSTKSRQPAGPASGLRRSNSGSNSVKDDAGGIHSSSLLRFHSRSGKKFGFCFFAVGFLWCFLRFLDLMVMCDGNSG